MSNDNTVVIGISASLQKTKDPVFFGYEISYQYDGYVQSVTECGAVPYIMPIINNDELIRKQVENIDGLILTGGYDVNPAIWGEEPNKKLGTVYPKRDEYEMKIFKMALEMNKPILGICRGIQFINAVEGGTLYQDLPSEEDFYIKHGQLEDPIYPIHTVNVKENTILRDILGTDKLSVNSFHHMAVKEAAPSYKVSAVSQDGVIEAIEKEGDKFVMGVQWHPEMMSQCSEQMKSIFMELVKQAAKRK